MRTPPIRKSQERRIKIKDQSEIDSIFDDAWIRAKAKTCKLPATIDFGIFCAQVLEAARIFAREARIPNRNELRDEISNLYRLADQRRYELLGTALTELTSEARKLLNRRNIDGQLPSPEALLIVEKRDAACEDVAARCRTGGTVVPGRKRPGGKQSQPHFEPRLYAPEPSRNFGRRDAERAFVMWLGLAYAEASGTSPPHTANNDNPGPFGKFAKECLTVMGAKDVNVVELMNELQRRRRQYEPRPVVRDSCGTIFDMDELQRLADTWPAKEQK